MAGRGRRNGNREEEEEEKVESGILWKLPVLKVNKVGNLGPALGLGVGCGVGFGIGLVGGAGFGPGIPGLQIGFGFGGGCGVGLGFGYGLGKGIAQDHKRRYSNLPLPHAQADDHSFSFFPREEIDALVDELLINTRKLIRATSREIDNWKR